MQKISVKQTINKLLSEFDFEKVHKTMTLLGWSWWKDGKHEVPNQVELFLTAQELLFEVASHAESGVTISTGGLEATAHTYPDGEMVLTLKFVLTSFNYSSQDTCY